MKKIVVFDFDGVVCDSTNECMVTSWNAWEKWKLRDGFRYDLSEFTREDKIDFRRVRPRVRGAGEYYILRRAFSENIRIDTQESYDELEKEWQEHINPFKKIFFEARDLLRKKDPSSWVDLHPVFDGVINVMKMFNDVNRLYIATLKDAESVKLILESQGLYLQDENLLDQSKINTKLQALDCFRSVNHCVKGDMIFVDDNVTHLLKPKSLGYKSYYNAWGNILPEYLSIAEKNGILPIDLDEIMGIL